MGIKTAVIFVGLCVPFFMGTIWAIVDVAQKDFGTMGKKALWWAIASVPFIGFIVYLLFGFRKGKKTGLTIWCSCFLFIFLYQQTIYPVKFFSVYSLPRAVKWKFALLSSNWPFNRDEMNSTRTHNWPHATDNIQLTTNNSHLATHKSSFRSI